MPKCFGTHSQATAQSNFLYHSQVHLILSKCMLLCSPFTPMGVSIPHVVLSETRAGLQYGYANGIVCKLSELIIYSM